MLLWFCGVTAPGVTAPARCPWRCPPTGLSCPLSSWWLGAEPHGLLAGSSLSPSAADGPEAPKKGASRRSPCPGTSAVAVPPPDGSGWGPGCGLQAGAGMRPPGGARGAASRWGRGVVCLHAPWQGPEPSPLTCSLLPHLNGTTEYRVHGARLATRPRRTRWGLVHATL